jgi:glycosyltransferase involved in cell wall biosynthesis
VSKKVLIFTYYWPPAGGVAVQRWLKFAKYLPEFGWEPIIITVANGSYPYYDESLLKEISLSLRVYHTKTFEPFELYNLMRGKRGKSLPLVSVGSQNKKSFFQKITEYIRANYFIPDARKGWMNYAVKKAEDILKKEKIDAIVTTGPPHSTHLIGEALKAKHGLMWLADFRDPWTGIFYNKILPRTEATNSKDKALETKVLQTADEVVVISPGLKKEFGDRNDKIEVVYNGYDEDDFLKSQITNPKSETINHKPEIFSIRYVGNMMSSQNVPALWKMIDELLLQYSDIRLEFIGRVDEDVKASITENGLSEFVSYSDFVPHEEAIRLMREAQLLLFIIPDVKDNELILTGKLFEYLATRNEILAFGPVDGDAAHILAETSRKRMLSYHDTEAIRKQLNEALLQFYKSKTSLPYPADNHRAYSRRGQAAHMAKLLEG